MTFYGEDLAHIHDSGHSGHALGAAPGLLRILARHGITRGLVVDLGCGSGRWAHELNRAGFDVLGIDRSRALLRLARRIAPRSRFAAASLWTARLPSCAAVTSMGECLNYDPGDTLSSLFSGVHDALRPGGILLFDAAEPSRAPVDGPRRVWNEGRGWAVLVETEGDPKLNALTRRIVSFRKVGTSYRRTEETHWLRLYPRDDVLQELARAGFRAQPVDRFGAYRLPNGICGFVAQKIATTL